MKALQSSGDLGATLEKPPCAHKAEGPQGWGMCCQKQQRGCPKLFSAEQPGCKAYDSYQLSKRELCITTF